MYFNATANCAYRETAELIAGHSARDGGGREGGRVEKGDGTRKTGGRVVEGGEEGKRRGDETAPLFWGTCPWVSVFRGALIPHYPDG